MSELKDGWYTEGRLKCCHWAVVNGLTSFHVCLDGMAGGFSADQKWFETAAPDLKVVRAAGFRPWMSGGANIKTVKFLCAFPDESCEWAEHFEVG